MSLQQKVRESLKVAMKDKDQVALDTLRAVLAACTNEAITLGKSPQEELSDDQLLAVMKRLVKQRKDAIDQYTQAGRADLIAAEQAQLYILEQYLPAQMTETDIRAIAIRKQSEIGANDKTKSGILVGAVMKELAGQADGAIVKKVVDSLFG